MADRIRVEVVAGDATSQVLVTLDLLADATAADAVRAARLPERLPSLTVDEHDIGIFGKACAPDRVLADGDRVEVYQSLKADPKVVRRELAEMERRSKKTG
jgi:putative ubiquitin-RnfH superfamily antitoxin RatB of RatAB toxin-antitoxin module